MANARKKNKSSDNFSRRDFMKTTAAVSVATMLGSQSGAFAQGSDKIKVGLIGCGGRGTGAAKDCLNAHPGVEIVAMGDAFQDRLDSSIDSIKKDFPDRIKVTPETSFAGFDAYKKVLASDVSLVILATPPHFRPEHLAAAVEADKHVFMEKPVAVDPIGIRSVIASAQIAEEKKLGIVAGTQRRHQAHYVELLKRVQDGEIGEVVGGQCYWNMGGLWVKRKKPEWSEMEWQIRNWLYFTWLSGDHITEQHVHNIDVINWATGSPPVKCMGMGGRQVRTGPEYGNIFDHFAIEFEYPNGVRVMSMCRQTPGCADRVSEKIVGTKGFVYTDSSNGYLQKGDSRYEPGESPTPYVQEHKDLIESIHAGKPLNEAKRVAESTMCAIMGRMSAYTGRELSWKWVMNSSELDLSPEKYEFGDLPVRPIAVPGQTELI